MTVTGLVAAGRDRHQQLMVDTCVIERPTVGDLDGTTGEYPIIWTPVYSGVCRVKGPTAGNVTVTEVQAGEAEQATSRQVLVLPYGAADGAAVGDRVTVTGHLLDYRVVGQLDTSTITARALLIESVEVPPLGAGGAAGSVDNTLDGGSA